MKSKPYVICCPVCGALRVKRHFQSCGNCGVGLRYDGEFVFEGDWYWDKNKWIDYEELKKRVDKSQIV